MNDVDGDGAHGDAVPWCAITPFLCALVCLHSRSVLPCHSSVNQGKDLEALLDQIDREIQMEIPQNPLESAPQSTHQEKPQNPPESATQSTQQEPAMQSTQLQQKPQNPPESATQSTQQEKPQNPPESATQSTQHEKPQNPQESQSQSTQQEPQNPQESQPQSTQLAPAAQNADLAATELHFILP